MTESHDATGSSGPREGLWPTSSPEALRQRAREIADAKVLAVPDELSPAAARELIHDLQVHQIELELQNEELRRAQEALESARAKYFELYDLAPVSYFTLSEEGLILEVNLAGARLLDVTRDVLIKQPLSLFILREDQDDFYLACRQLARTGDQAFELRMAKSDGRPFWVWIEAATAYDDEGTLVWRMVMTDITFRKSSEQALRAAELLRESWSQYRQIAESLPQLVWTSGVDGSWDYISPQWTKYTGFPAAEHLGLGWARQLHPDDRGAAITKWDRAVSQGKPFNAEFRIRRHDGSFRRFKWRATPLRSDAGEVSRWFGTCSDLESPEEGDPVE